MKEVIIDPSDVEYAKNKLSQITTSSEELSKFGSEKERILIGYIGERIIMKLLNIKEDSDTFNYDLVFKNKKLEVKTISCKFKPYPNYLCTVNSHDINGIHQQDADYYIFLRILNDFSKGWILGYKRCKVFFKQGEFVEKGKNFGKFKFVKANATVLPIDKLRPIEEILKHVKNE